MTAKINNVIINKTAYRREVRCKSVATAITVIEAIHKSEYPVRFNKIFGQESNNKLCLFSENEYGLQSFAARKGRFLFMSEKTKEEYLDLLRAVASKEKRFPKKSDFSEDDVNRIKGFFGPWPWALEAAGLKESKQEERKQRNYEKRKRSKERRKGESNNA